MSQTRGGTSGDQVSAVPGVAGALVEIRETASADGALLAELVTDDFGLVPAYETPDRLDGLDVWLRARMPPTDTEPAGDWSPWIRVPGDRTDGRDGGGTALAAHLADPTPHPAYDTDLPSLSILFENGLI